MTWTYSGNPKDSVKDQVRFMIGDTDEGDQQLTDEEIEFLIGMHSTPLGAAKAAITGLIAKYSREVSYTIGPEKVSAEERVSNLQNLLATLAQTWTASGVPSWADTEATHPNLFDKGLHDYRRWRPSTTGSKSAF